MTRTECPFRYCDATCERCVLGDQAMNAAAIIHDAPVQYAIVTHPFKGAADAQRIAREYMTGREDMAQNVQRVARFAVPKEFAAQFKQLMTVEMERCAARIMAAMPKPAPVPLERYVGLINEGGDYCGFGLASDYPEENADKPGEQRVSRDGEWYRADDVDALIERLMK